MESGAAPGEIDPATGAARGVGHVACTTVSAMIATCGGRPGQVGHASPRKPGAARFSVQTDFSRC
jgi:hypothetical protein